MSKKKKKTKLDLWHHILFHKYSMATIFVLIVFSVAWIILYQFDFTVESDIKYGVTYSKSHAQSLNLNWKDTLIAALDDQGIRHFRLPAYWTEIEPTDDQFDFAALDWQINQIGKRDGTVILAIGQRVPRWPECHIPQWATNLPQGQRQQKILQMLPVIVSRYEDNPTVISWQVENEPLLPFFGECEKPDEEFLKKEISLVKRMDSTRPIMTTASGELGNWDRTGEHVDVLGVSLYRTIYKQPIGYFNYPIPPGFYKLRAQATEHVVDKVILTEMQAEPWLPGAPPDIALEEQYKTMTPKIFEETLIYARASGFDEIYLWGIEWWYWLKTSHNNDGMWEAAREISW